MTACVNNEILMQVEVNQEHIVGFNIDAEKLYFGRMSPGAISERNIIINSSTFGCVKAKGELAEWTETKPKCFFGNTQVNVTAKIPLDARTGNYTGKLIVTII